MFVRDFKSELESFGCAKEKASGPMLKDIQKQLNLIYLNNDEHTNMDRANGSKDLLDINLQNKTKINLAKHDIQFQIGDDLGSDHLPIEVSTDAPLHRNPSINHTKRKFDQTDREVFESTLEAVLGSTDFSALMTTSDLDKYADFIVSAISTAADKAIPKSKSLQSEGNPISDETIALIKEKHRLRRQYSQNKHPVVKTCINQLQKQVKVELRVETQAIWEKFCNFINLETDPSESWRKIFLKPKCQCDHPTLRHDDKVAKTNADKAQLFAESVERHFGIESEHFDWKRFNEVNKFIEDNLKYLYPPEDPDNYRFDVGNERKLVEDADAQSLIKLSFLKEVKPQVPIPYTMRYLG